MRYQRAAARAFELLASYLKTCGAVKGREIDAWSDEFDGAGPGYPYDSPPAMLSLFETARSWVARAEREFVRSLRAGGWTWQRIGDEYGITRQAAYERWCDVEDSDEALEALSGRPLVDVGREEPAGGVEVRGEAAAAVGGHHDRP